MSLTVSAESSSVGNKVVEPCFKNDESCVVKSYSSPSSDNCENDRRDSDLLSNARANKKIFVGALTPETTEQNLMDYFSKFGEVVSCAVKVSRDTGYSRGFGFIVFKSDDAVKKVFSISEHIVNGKKIDPKPAKCPKDTQRKVFVGGLDPEVSPKEIEDHFRQFGKVEAVETPFDNIKLRRRSYAFVVFSSEYEAKQAALTERQEINGKSCDVRVAVPREVSLRQRVVQATPQLTVADLQQAMLNFFYYSSLSQQPALQNQLAWHQHHHHPSSRPNLRTSYEQQATEKLFNPSTMTRGDTSWYDASGIRTQNSVTTNPSRNSIQPPASHPYLALPFPFQSAAAPHFYYQATPGYYYQPTPPSVSHSETQTSPSGLNGTINQVNNQTTAMNDFMTAMVTANHVPFIAAPAPSNYATGVAGDVGYPFRHQQAINPTFYQNTSADCVFGDPSSNIPRPLFYGTGLASSSSSGIKSRPAKPQPNGVNPRSFQNGFAGKDAEGSITVTDHSKSIANGSASAGLPLETSMASLSVAEI